jgi:hypothetical protein
MSAKTYAEKLLDPRWQKSKIFIYVMAQMEYWKRLSVAALFAKMRKEIGK